MLVHIDEYFDIIPRVAVMTYLNCCENCQMKKNKPKKGLVVNPILSIAMNSRCQVDLIDWQTLPAGECNGPSISEVHFAQIYPNFN